MRELENTVAELLALSDDGVLATDSVRPVTPPAAAGGTAQGSSLRQRLENFERDLLREALAEARDNQSQAARTLETTRTTLIDKMKRLGIKG